MKLTMRSVSDATPGSRSHASRHHALREVRLCDVIFFASPVVSSYAPESVERVNSWLPTVAAMSASASSVVRKLSIVTTHGSRECTVMPISGKLLSMPSKNFVRSPGPIAGTVDMLSRSRSHRTFGSRRWHASHERGQFTIIQPGLCMHSPRFASETQRG